MKCSVKTAEVCKFLFTTEQLQLVENWDLIKTMLIVEKEYGGNACKYFRYKAHIILSKNLLLISWKLWIGLVILVYENSVATDLKMKGIPWSANYFRFILKMGKYLSNLNDPEKTRVDMRDWTGQAIALSHAIELRKEKHHGPRPPVQDDHYVNDDNMLDDPWSGEV